MKKRLASLLLCAALLVSAVPGAKAVAFIDITDAETAVAAATLQGLGVVSGTSSETFQPNGTLTRAQVCVMAVNMMGLSNQVGTYSRKTLFTDVPSNSWYNGYVNLAYSEGIINGYGNGKFGPNDIITYGQLATILLRILGYTTAEIGSIWPADYTAYAKQLGLSDGMNLGDNQSVTRGQGALLFYRALKANVNGTDREYYHSISGLSSTTEAILLDVNASYGGNSGLLKAISTQGETLYYSQSKRQSAALEGSLGQILFDASGKVMGFIPDSESYEDVVISSASASALKSTSGQSLYVSADVSVIAAGETYTYHNGGYLQLDKEQGKTVRVFYDEDGSVLCLYLAGGTAVSSEAAVADSTSALSELERELGLSGKSYALTKNGVAADKDDLGQYDVGYFDAASNTLCVSDYRVAGFLSSASPSVTAAQTVSVAGNTFEVMECAWDTLGDFQLGDKVTLLLTDDCKVAAVYKPTKVSADMIGVLDAQGKSVTLAGSGITLTAGTVNYSGTVQGSLVKVSASGSTNLSCTAVGTSSAGTLDLEVRTLGSLELAPSCAVYEWAGSGYVYDLEGNHGRFSTDFDTIDWTDSLSSSYVSTYHTNSAGQVDMILLKNVTGNCYTYGKILKQESQSGQSGGTMTASNQTATITNHSGTSSKYIITQSATSNSYVGVTLGQSLIGDTMISKVQTLSAISHGEDGDFFRQNDKWYVQMGDTVYPISDQVEVHFYAADSWQSGEDGLMAALADGYDLTLYYDRTVSQGGQVRLVVAK